MSHESLSEPVDPPSSPSIDQLQRHIKRLNWMVGIMLLLLLLTLLKSLDTRGRLRELVLIDSNGIPRAVIGTRDDTPFFSMFDAGGHARISFGIEPDGPMLRLSNPGSRTHAGIWLSDRGARLALVNPDGSGLQIQGEDRNARIHFQDHSGWPRLGLGVDDGSPFIGLMETNLMPRVILGSDSEGGRLSFFDDQSTRRLSLGVYQDRPFLNPITDADP